MALAARKLGAVWRADNLTRAQLVQYAGTSGDCIHADEAYTTQVAGYPTVFAHGMLTMGMTGKMLTSAMGCLTRFGVRFTRQVWPGYSLTAQAAVEAIRGEGGVFCGSCRLHREAEGKRGAQWLCLGQD